MVRSANPDSKRRFTHLRWAKVFAENAPDFMRDVIRTTGRDIDIYFWMELYSSQARDPNVNRERLMDGWIA